MLAQNFMTPTDLGISEVEQTALVTVLGMLERREIDDEHFNMSSYQNECGTVGCLCGWAYMVSEGAAFPEVALARGATPKLSRRLPDTLRSMFWIDRIEMLFKGATAAQAAQALRTYLTTGKDDWANVLR